MSASHLSTHLRRGLGVIALACMLAAVSLPASAGMENPKDTATVQAVKLDSDLLHRVAAASKEAEAALEGQDSVFYLLDESTHKPRTVDAVIAELTAKPEVMAALRQHQLDVREYVLATLAFMNGYIAAMRIKAEGEQSWNELDQWGVNEAHVRFCMDHLDELKNAL